MSDFNKIDGCISGNISIASEIKSDIQLVKTINVSLNKQNPEIDTELFKIDGEIAGQIISTHNISSEISNNFSIQGQISAISTNIQVPIYDGVYEVVPIPQLNIVLNTSNKVLKNNIIVKEIPYYQTSNESGGYTVIIG